MGARYPNAALGMTQHVPRHTAEKKLAEGTPAGITQQNQVGLLGFRKVADHRPDRIPFEQMRADLSNDGTQLFDDTCDQLFPFAFRSRDIDGDGP